MAFHFRKLRSKLRKIKVRTPAEQGQWEYPNLECPICYKNLTNITIEVNHGNINWPPQFCKEILQKEENIPQTLNCGHQFHKHCLRSWFLYPKGLKERGLYVNCPLCRKVQPHIQKRYGGVKQVINDIKEIEQVNSLLRTHLFDLGKKYNTVLLCLDEFLELLEELPPEETEQHKAIFAYWDKHFSTQIFPRNISYNYNRSGFRLFTRGPGGTRLNL
tara:strand:+ start:192 stop:842 length:651 start_codon:yes stop_codon:yes gene_type:complete